MTNAEPIIGHCLCGAVTIRVTGKYEENIGTCHCRMCQQWAGGLLVCFEAEAAGVMIEGPVIQYASSAVRERAFCPICGSHLWFRNLTAEPPAYQLMTGLFEKALNWSLRYEAYSDCALAALPLKGEHERMTRFDFQQIYGRHGPGDLP